LIKTAIIGATGYTGVELIKILINHTKFDLMYLFSNSDDKIDKIYQFLDGVCNLSVSSLDIDKIKRDCDLVFLALPHMNSMEIVKKLSPSNVKIVDLSADYRLNRSHYEEYYCKHTDVNNLDNFIYGIPEIFKKEIRNSNYVSNPGCYPTISLLTLFAFYDYIDTSKPIIIDAKSGVSGSGKKLTDSSHYVKINENMFTYNPFVHRHAIEIKEKSEMITKQNLNINFVPTLIPVTRGMSVNIYATINRELDSQEVLRNRYKNNKFIRIKENPTDLKSVSGTHFCDIYSMVNDETLFINASIDNLLRGASSQAVVNANIMFGLDENIGIPTISYAP
jgi:N-acetyl-gamma-glutamyl-phosphate reductase